MISGLAFYSSGIIDKTACPGEIIYNHSILIVGYGSYLGKEFWIIKN